MSGGVIDVGDAFELTFTTAVGADVEVTWLDPDQAPVFSDVTVAETPAGSGRFPFTFLPDRAGVWTAQFRASGAATQFEQYWVRASSVSGPLPLAVLGDLAGQMGSLTTAQESIANWLLRAASALVRSRYPGIDDLITAGTLSADVVALGVANMVVRVLRNPRGLRQETVGPFSRAYDTSNAAGLLVITDEEAVMFTVAAATPVMAVGSIRMTPGLVPVESRAGCYTSRLL